MKEVLNAIETLGKYLGLDPAVVGILLVLPFGMLYWRFRYNKEVLQSIRGLARVCESLETHDWRSAYFGGLQRTLAWADNKLGQSAWGPNSYELTLNLAFIYPFASLCIVWVITGQNTSGIANMLGEAMPAWERVLFTLSACIGGYFAFQFSAHSVWRWLVYSNIAFVMAFTLSGGAAATFAFTLAGIIESGVAVAMTGAVLVSTALAISYAPASGGTVVVTLISAIVATIFVTIIRVMVCRRGLKGAFYVIFSIAMLCILTILISNTGWLNSRTEVVHFAFVFLAFLPLINSAFDWLSLASTRVLLQGLAKSDKAPVLLLVRNATFGVILGLFFLGGLAITVTVGVQTANLLSQGHGGPQYVDVAGLLYRLRYNPGDPSVWWVYFTLFSTMLPTVAHAAIASASFVAWRLPESWKRHWLGLLDYNIKDDPPVLIGMAWRLTLMEAATVVLAVLAAAALAVLVWLIAREGMWLLWLCERVAEWLGAPIQI